MVIGIYAGSFDPLTNGHVWMIEEAVSLFQKVYVAVGVNPAKKTMFSVEERRSHIADIWRGCYGIEVISFKNEFLVNVALRLECTHILRGVRNIKDFEEEVAMAEINKDIANMPITTVFLAPPSNLAQVSSSMVKSLIGFQGWEEHVQKYVPKSVFEAIQRKVS